MKRIIASAFAASLLVGCGGSGGDSPPTTPEVTPPPEVLPTVPCEGGCEVDEGMTGPFPPLELEPAVPVPTAPCGDEGECLEDDGFTNPSLPMIPTTPPSYETGDMQEPVLDEEWLLRRKVASTIYKLYVDSESKYTEIEGCDSSNWNFEPTKPDYDCGLYYVTPDKLGGFIRFQTNEEKYYFADFEEGFVYARFVVDVPEGYPDAFTSFQHDGHMVAVSESLNYSEQTPIEVISEVYNKDSGKITFDARYRIPYDTIDATLGMGQVRLNFDYKMYSETHVNFRAFVTLYNNIYPNSDELDVWQSYLLHANIL